MLKDAFKFLGEMIVDWISYKQRGRVQPDRADDKDAPIIVTGADASAQAQIDRILKPKKKKKSS